MVARIVSTFSALLVLAALAAAGPYADLDQQLKKAGSLQDRLTILQDSKLVQSNAQLKSVLSGENDEDDNTNVNSACEIVSLQAMAESTPSHSNLRAVAEDIKRSPVYSDPGERDTTTWLGKALERLRNWHWDMPKSNIDGPDLGFLGKWVIYLAWALLGGAVIAFLYFGLRAVNFKKLLARRAKLSILDEQEPERTLDEWLVLADQLEREGRHREAVRSLYLACLLKIDESRIARFDRGQTNWEHLARIEASPRRPSGLDFRKPTQAFDRIWYGYQVNGAADVERFRTWYLEIVDATRQVAA